jgi:hypothetical protein
MPDLQEFKVERNPKRIKLTVPTWSISCLVTDSETGETLADRTGYHGINFPEDFVDLPEEIQDEFVKKIATWLIGKHTGIEMG